MRTVHSADVNGDYQVELVELLRVIQFYNAGGLHCVRPPRLTEDGYAPVRGPDLSCCPHSADYAPPGGDWIISLSELLRLGQLYQSGGYAYCPDQGTEDGFCPLLP